MSTIHTADAEKMTNASTPKQRVAKAADAAKEAAVEKAEATVASAQEGAQQVQDSLVKLGEKARDVTEKQPIAVAAGALAIGVLIGLAVNKNR